MPPRPYSGRSVLPSDSSTSSISVESDTAQLTVDTSLGSMSGVTTPSPTDVGILTDLNSVDIPEDDLETEASPSSFYPTPADSMPFDHAFPDFIRQLTNENNLSNVHSLRLRVISSLVSLQRLSLFTTNLRELDLEGSVLGSLRDIGCNLKFLQILKVGKCQLDSLDGTFGLTSLRKLYAQRNLITDVSPCSNLPHIEHIDVSRNRIRNIAYAGFLSVCRKLKSINFTGNPAAQLSDYRSHVKRILPQITILDGINFSPEGNMGEDSKIDGVTAPQFFSQDGLSENDYDEQSEFYISENEERTSSDENFRNSMHNSDEPNNNEILADNLNHGKDFHIISLRREKDTFKPFGKPCDQNINHEQTENLVDLHIIPTSCQAGNSKGNLTFPPLHLPENEPRKSITTEEGSSFSKTFSEARKLSFNSDIYGEKSNFIASELDFEVLNGSNTERDGLVTVSGFVTRTGTRPSTAGNIHTSPKYAQDFGKNPDDFGRPSSSGSAQPSTSTADEDIVGEYTAHKSLTSGLPICGNLAVALRNRRKQE